MSADQNTAAEHAVGEREVGTVGGEKRWRVAVDADQCVGAGVCVGTAPEHFRLDAGVSRPIHELADPDELLLAAEESCPVAAIGLRDAATGAVIPPVP